MSLAAFRSKLHLAHYDDLYACHEQAGAGGQESGGCNVRSEDIEVRHHPFQFHHRMRPAVPVDTGQGPLLKSPASN